MIATTACVLGALTTLLCAILLLRRYSQVGLGLLLWSGLCFAGLTANYVMLLIDRLVVPDVDLFVLRLLVTAAAMSMLVFGLIWDSE